MQIALRKVFIGSIMVKYDMPRFVNASSPINGGRAGPEERWHEPDWYGKGS